jgi:hypothetical protein
MKKLLCTLALLGLAGLGLPAAAAGEKEKDVNKGDPRYFELRTYYAAAGKLDALNARFRDHTNKLFKKHGMEIIGFWEQTEPKVADEKLIYILAYPSKDAADKSWKAFRDDPDWKKAREASEKDGVLVKKVESVWMTPTDYSPIK